MDKNLELELVRRFPILYQDYTSPMSQTCMCWGFDHGNGWRDIIWQLSLAIEDELGYSVLQEKWFLFKKTFARRWNDTIYKLSPVRQRKYKREGSGITGDPIRMVETHYDPPLWDEKIAQFFFGKMKKVGQFESERMGLKNLVFYPKTGFAVTQVKEKFGTLRFYAPGNDRIYRLISFAEELSAITCEECGAHNAVQRGGGWIRTLCDKCYVEKEAK